MRKPVVPHGRSPTYGRGQGVQMYYKIHLRFPPENSLHAPGSGPGCCRSGNPSRRGSRIKGRQKQRKMKDRPTRNCLIQVRLTPEEMERVKALMAIRGYTVYSCFVRDLIMQKRLPYRQEIPQVSDKELREKLNALVYQINKIGINYNQVVAIWQKQSRQTRPDGTPYMNTRYIDALIGELKTMTEGLRDEFAFIYDVFKKYLGDSQDTSTI